MTEQTETQIRKNIFIIHNPNSGNQKQKFFLKVCKILKKAGCELTIVKTSCFGEGATRSKEASQSGLYDGIVAVGGDGTIQDVAIGMMGGDTPLGIIPTGTGNVLARELNYKFSAKFVAQNLLQGIARPVHVGMANTMPFLFAASVGYDAEVVRGFDKGNGRKIGRAGYAIPGIKALFGSKSGDLTVTTDSGSYGADWVIVSRVRFYASDFLLCPQADIANDLFHVVRMTGKGKFQRIRHLIGLGTNRLSKMKGVNVEVSKFVRVEGDTECNIAQIDGEVAGTLPLEFSIHPQQLTVIAPLS